MAADFDINNIDFNNVGDWPIPVKAVAIVIVCAALVGAGYYYDTQEQLGRLEAAKSKESSLRNEFESKQKQANALEKLKQQLKEIEQSFGELLRRLPSKAEVEAVLVDISQTGLANGLDFKLFRPGAEREGEGGFYRELPIELILEGDYHSIGKFISGVAALPRIVTQHDIKITPAEGSKLNMKATAKTYRYVDDEEGEGK